MTHREPPLEELLPIELKLRILEAELDRLESDARWVEQRRQEVLKEIDSYSQLLASKRRKSVLHIVK
jgi:hypothetical protein